MKKIDPKEISENTIKLIGSDWMLVASGDEDKFNMMTASWGALGYIWNKPCAFIFVRPQRYTLEFIEKFDLLSLNFFDCDNPEHGGEYRKALTLCGKKSGREINKMRESGLTPAFTENKTPYFSEAKLVLECKKLYAGKLNAEDFLDDAQISTWYPDGDFHKMYIAEIVGVRQQ